MNTFLTQKRLVNQVLTNLVLGFNLDQAFSGHHLFPDVTVNQMSGKIVKWGKEAFVIVNSKRVPGETVRGVGINYSSEDYTLENRLLEAIIGEEELEESKVANLKLEAQAVNTLFHKMRLEGEQDKALLATNADNYATTNKATLSGTDLWSNPTADVSTLVGDAKSTIRAKTGKYPNVLHLDAVGYEHLKRNEKIREQFKYSGKAFVTEEMLANYFDVEKVVVGRAIHTPDEDSDFLDIWKDNSILAYVPEKSLRAKAVQSFGYNYVGKDFPKVEKKYFANSDRSYHTPVLFRDKAIITDSGAGFLFQNTSA